jgi:type 1 glutamine amidotransferase
VVPLLRTDADVDATSMIDAYIEVSTGERVAATPQPGSTLLAWAKQVRNSRLVYVLPGHNASTMEHAMYRRLLANAVRWSAQR